MANPRAGILHDPGGGKTPTCAVMAWWRWDSAKERTCWVMPKQLMRKNKKELLRFTHFKAEEVVIIDGPKWKDRLEDPQAKVFLMGPARFRLCWHLLPKDVQQVIGDEIHLYWTKTESAATQALYQASNRIERFVGMTGTPIKGRLDSCYPMIAVIEPRYYGSYQGFMNHHALVDMNGKTIGWHNADRVSKIIGKHCIRRSFESIYGPEAKVIVTEQAPMATKQREVYDQWETQALLELEDSFLESPNQGVHALRCRQIMSHPETFGLTDGERTGKDELLEIHLAHHELSGEPLIMFSCFVPEQERLVKWVQERGMSVGLMNGTVSNTKRLQLDEDFRAGKVQVLVGSPAVAAVGYNWDHCNHVIFSSLSYGDDEFVQGYRRAIRGKRSTPLLITILEYEDSLDQRILDIIKRKSALAAEVDPSKEVFDLRTKT
jgi:SNF2 family DNA or RNA helicase